VADWDRDTPWRQGHLLTEDAQRALDLNHPEYPDQTVIVMVSHDCDLAQSAEREPVAEVIIGRWVEKPDGNYTNAKTARTIHLAFKDTDDKPYWAEFEAPNKRAIPKDALSSFGPRVSTQLNPDARETFQRWLASRYRRPAFPTEFERRLKNEGRLAERISKAVQPLGNLIVALLFDVDGGVELTRNGPNDAYMGSPQETEKIVR
jgi:hypothetical protein